jgi:hypothetical protein
VLSEARCCADLQNIGEVREELSLEVSQSRRVAAELDSKPLLGYFCLHRPDRAEDGAPSDWGWTTPREHQADARPVTYSLEQFEEATKHDVIWNAAQDELRTRGRIHDYLRMLWGKKILHWSRSPQEALDIMIELNNKYPIDGRDPNSCSGIFRVLGRFGLTWGPEREVFGNVRCTSSKNTRRKLRLDGYLKRWGEADFGRTAASVFAWCLAPGQHLSMGDPRPAEAYTLGGAAGRPRLGLVASSLRRTRVLSCWAELAARAIGAGR